ncbi:MAG: hypothetical protein M0Q91_13285 [Methanoregula sp.]|jgi:hypothetical protein|nr:hypothetical protein [Methanoregula sp.]
MTETGTIQNRTHDQRQITDCPVRIAYAQLINETDEDFASFLYERGLTPDMNTENFYAARARADPCGWPADPSEV